MAIFLLATEEQCPNPQMYENTNPHQLLETVVLRPYAYSYEGGSWAYWERRRTCCSALIPLSGPVAELSAQAASILPWFLPRSPTSLFADEILSRLGGFAPQSPAGGERGEPSPVPHPSHWKSKGQRIKFGESGLSFPRHAHASHLGNRQSSCLLPFHQPPHGPSVQKSRVREACPPRPSPPACPPLEA